MCSSLDTSSHKVAKRENTLTILLPIRRRVLSSSCARSQSKSIFSLCSWLVYALSVKSCVLSMTVSNAAVRVSRQPGPRRVILVVSTNLSKCFNAENAVLLSQSSCCGLWKLIIEISPDIHPPRGWPGLQTYNLFFQIFNFPLHQENNKIFDLWSFWCAIIVIFSPQSSITLIFLKFLFKKYHVCLDYSLWFYYYIIYIYFLFIFVRKLLLEKMF